jgi:hypothetical protein
VVLALCLASSALCVAGQALMGSAPLPLPFGYVTSVCVVRQTTPRVQIGVRWMSPLLSSVLPPYGGLANGCVIVPWLPGLPQQGALVGPP